jgi:hypothetical protein
MNRIICWFSCGAASAVNAKLTIEQRKGIEEVIVCYCNTLSSEHPDNKRFLVDCEKWFGQPVQLLSNNDYTDVDDVIEKTRYMAGIKGARCTTELKKVPRLRFARPDDIHCFGFTSDKKELKRIASFEMRNPELRMMWTLRDLGVTKQMCYRAIQGAGIRLPTMYELGFENNNCPGCLKATSAWYWDRIRHHFPEVFLKRCAQSRELGVRLVRVKGKRVFLDLLPAGPFKKLGSKENMSCGPECGGPVK